MVGAEAACELDLALSAGRRDDACARAGRELHEQAPDPAGGGLDEDRLPRLDVRRLEEHQRGAAVGEQRDRVRQLEAVGDLDEQVLIGDSVTDVTLASSTSTTTWPAPGNGSGWSSIFRCSGGPNAGRTAALTGG